MLTLRNLQAGYDGCTALHGVSVVVEDQSITGIVGPSGAGKTTLANCICGYVPAIAGQIFLEDRHIAQRPASERLMRGIACVPAARRLFPDMSVLENLQLGAADSAASKARRQFDFALSVFPELKPHLRESAGGLSLCLQRVLMFARALMSAPRLLILDQPSYGLSGEQAQKLTRTIPRLIGDQLTSILLLEQNLFHAVKVADVVYRMTKGRITGKHSGLELLAHPTLQSEFLRGALQPSAEAMVL